ncbi:MAG: M3 family oligoendopeptidase [Patescibacteria group bacterium]|nr:M3 family oligoendopeptidase [Patescibacteria group bacterium]
MDLESQNLPKWDLTDFFTGIDDPNIAAQIQDVHQKAEAFANKFRDKINNSNISLAVFLEALTSYNDILEQITKIGAFAHLNYSADTSDPKNGAFLQKIQSEYEKLMQTLLFFDIQILELPQEKLEALIKNPELKKFSHYLRILKDYKPHQLSEPEEKIMTAKSLTGGQAFCRLFEQEMAAKVFKIDGDDKDFSEAEILSILYDSDRDKRKNAASAVTTGLKEEIRRLAFITNTLLQEKKINDRFRNFSSPEAERHLDNQISQSTVDQLSNTVKNNYFIVQDFYHHKRDLLGYEELFDYDRYAPIEDKTPKYTYEQAQEIVISSFKNFDPKFAEIAKEFIDKNWIDIGSRAGKQAGAFCSFITPNHHPLILLNYQGTARDVMTMAHELGHGIHAYLARKQNYLQFHAPLTVCETASIFCEMLVFESLKEKLQDDPKALKTLYISKIEEIFASVFRQMAMYHFEKNLHAAHAKKGEILVEEINAIWRETQTEMFGDSVTLTKGYDYWWSYIPHFINTPFYVYAYSFGELLSLSVYNLYKQKGDSIKQTYFDFLEAGGSKSPNDLVKGFDMDLDDPKFWEVGMGLIRNLIKEMKKL